MFSYFCLALYTIDNCDQLIHILERKIDWLWNVSSRSSICIFLIIVVFTNLLPAYLFLLNKDKKLHDINILWVLPILNKKKGISSILQTTQPFSQTPPSINHWYGLLFISSLEGFLYFGHFTGWCKSFLHLLKYIRITSLSLQTLNCWGMKKRRKAEL